jgi:hypothetical protein
MSDADLALVDTAITNILRLINTITADPNAPQADYSDNGESVSMGAYLAILTGRVRELRQLKVQVKVLWLGTDYNTTRQSGVNILPPWLPQYLT